MAVLARLESPWTCKLFTVCSTTSHGCFITDGGTNGKWSSIVVGGTGPSNTTVSGAINCPRLGDAGQSSLLSYGLSVV